jgi:hypothetical protein
MFIVLVLTVSDLQFGGGTTDDECLCKDGARGEAVVMVGRLGFCGTLTRIFCSVHGLYLMLHIMTFQ